jgi:hypothetical protein
MLKSGGEWRQGVAKPVWREGLGGSRSTVYTGHERRTLEFSRATNVTQEDATGVSTSMFEIVYFGYVCMRVI